MMNMNKLKEKSEKILKERTLLYIYAVAITGALLISLYHNNSVKASIPHHQELSESLPQDLNIDQEFVGEEMLEALETELPEQEKSENYEVVTVEKGDTFVSILTKRGLGYSQADYLYKILKKVYDARNIRIGQSIHITSLPKETEDAELEIIKIMIEPVSGTKYILEKDEDGNFQAVVEQEEFVSESKTLSGTISGNVSAAMTAVGVPSKVVGNFINIFSFSVDFRRDVKSGDQFEVRYEQQLNSEGKVIKTGDIIYAALQLGRDKIALYRFKDKNGQIDYYDEKGLALKKNLDRKPMEYKRARISSKFGSRLHPILKVYKSHHGVDYAAPQGSKVYASGDGVIKMAKWYGGYGNFIAIRHNSEYSTGYGHLKSFAKGIRPGVRVKQGQIIAYVGSTGRSTGPHLHFEVIKNGKKVDPLKVRAATGENLTGEKLSQFKKIVAQVKSEMQENTAVAESVQTQENIISN